MVEAAAETAEAAVRDESRDAADAAEATDATESVDVVKPPPIRKLERVGGGDGIMLDDVLAGVYALAVLTVLRVLLPGAGNWTV